MNFKSMGSVAQRLFMQKKKKTVKIIKEESGCPRMLVKSNKKPKSVLRNAAQNRKLTLLLAKTP